VFTRAPPALPIGSVWGSGRFLFFCREFGSTLSILGHLRRVTQVSLSQLRGGRCLGRFGIFFVVLWGCLFPEACLRCFFFFSQLQVFFLWIWSWMGCSVLTGTTPNPALDQFRLRFFLLTRPFAFDVPCNPRLLSSSIWMTVFFFASWGRSSCSGVFFCWVIHARWRVFWSI